MRPSVPWMLLLFALGLLGCDPKALTVHGGDEVSFVNPSGEVVSARFYELSDGSLSFVQLVLPGGQKFTLPQGVSGSGARYSDGYQLEFWNKGDEMTLRKPSNTGEWVIVGQGVVRRR